MLRSEVTWFPRFIRYCRYHLLVMPEDEEGSVIQDKAMLKRVADCDGWRQVQTLVNDYGETAFSDLVYEIQDHASMCKTCVHDDNYLNDFFTQKERSVIYFSINAQEPKP